MAAYLECYRCGTRSDDLTAQRCDCGEPLWLRLYSSPTGFEPRGSTDGIWRYHGRLPLTDSIPLGTGVGDTALIRHPALDEYAGCTVHVKDEAQNPRGVSRTEVPSSGLRGQQRTVIRPWGLSPTGTWD